MIYAVQILRLQYVKIGYTQHEDVAKRISELQTGCPFEITPLLTVRGSLTEEKAMHGALDEMFAQMHVPTPPNEWYPGRHPLFAKFLNELKYGAQAGLAFCDSRSALQSDKGVKAGPERHNLKPKRKWATGVDNKAHRQSPHAWLPGAQPDARSTQSPPDKEASHAH
jgi:hypothetical protein